MKELKSARESAFDRPRVCLFCIKKVNFSSSVTTLIMEEVCLHQRLTPCFRTSPPVRHAPPVFNSQCCGPAALWKFLSALGVAWERAQRPGSLPPGVPSCAHSQSPPSRLPQKWRALSRGIASPPGRLPFNLLGTRLARGTRRTFRATLRQLLCESPRPDGVRGTGPVARVHIYVQLLCIRDTWLCGYTHRAPLGPGVGCPGSFSSGSVRL